MSAVVWGGARTPAVPAPKTLEVATPMEAGIAVTSATKDFAPGLLGKLEQIVAEHEGRMGLSVVKLGTGETFEVNADAEFVTASTIKLGVLGTAFDLLTSPSATTFKGYYDTMVYDGSTSSGGSGFIQNYKVPTRIELKELVHFMITASDNTATNMLTKWVGGPQAVNQWLASKGLARTRMNSTIGGRQVADQALREKWGLGVTTPAEMRRLMQMYAEGKAVDSTTASEEILRVLGHQYFDDDIASQVPPTMWVGSKSGAVNASRSDVAIMSTSGGLIVMAVYTDENRDQRWVDDNAGEVSIRRVAKAVFDHFNPDYKPAKAHKKTSAVTSPAAPREALGGGEAAAGAATDSTTTTTKGDTRMETATFGMGCFWGPDELFRKTPGVVETAVGYAGGEKANPTYGEVCNDNTGHAEVVQVKFDPEKISYAKLLEIFWKSHNPTTLNRQGPDVGSQYRSVIFFHSPEQEKTARESVKQATLIGGWKNPVVTQILPAQEFWKAEDYHQKYLMKRGLDVCH